LLYFNHKILTELIELKLFIVFLILISTIHAQVTKLGTSVKYLSDFIASKEFANQKLKLNDYQQVDLLFKKAMIESDDDIGDALFNLTFTLIPYDHIPVVTPIFKLPVNVSLPHSVDSIFNLKNKNLPKNLFYDSPQTEFGDKDKLAHFFGSAYLAYGSKWFDFTQIIGIFVEDFEERFYIQSKVDLRDIRADNLGNIFGKTLKKNKDLLPSQILAAYHLTFFRYNL
jgi:hypothetical protein